MKSTLFRSLLLAWVALTPTAAAADEALHRALAELAEPQMRAADAVVADGIRLDQGIGTLQIESGVLFPSLSLAGRVVEAIFVGQAQFQLAPPDDIEAAQLELFTDGRRLDEEVTQAVLVIPSNALSESLFGEAARPADPDATVREEAAALHRRWLEGVQRLVLSARGALLRDALGERSYDGYFAAWMHGEETGDFLYVIEPGVREQITLGQFTPLELEGRARRRAERLLHREQRRGRFIGLEVDRLGTWDTWVSTHLRDAEGQPSPGVADFEPERYGIDVRLDPKAGTLTGTARIELLPNSGQSRVVPVTVFSDLRIESVRDAEGRDLPHFPDGSETLVVLPERPPAGERLSIEIDYSGQAIEKVYRKIFQLRDTMNWHPHTGLVDRARYDVTFRWPKPFSILAGGRKVDGGVEGKEHWARYELDLPTVGFGFEIGRFEITTARVGHVEVQVAMDPVVAKARQGLGVNKVLKSLTDSIEYFEEIFGPYPQDHLNAVVSWRLYSQSLPGFLTLSALMVSDLGSGARLGFEDPQTVIAHEVAHQWWGHQVGFESYRDQWFSEAMANYAAVLFERHRLKGRTRRQGFGPTFGWQIQLLQTLPDGRPIEAVGPLALGGRLDSSRAAAYAPVVYSKGAVVLDMLARRWGEERFLELLARIAQLVDYRSISTDTFLQMLEGFGGQDLDGFAEQFVYSTGLPEFYYDYRFEEVGEGRWRVIGEARQQSPYHYDYRVVRKTDGSMDVERQATHQVDVERTAIIVPFQLAIVDPEATAAEPADEDDSTGSPDEKGNATLHGQLLLQGTTSTIDFETDYLPKDFWLDRRSEVFARFFNQRREPKRTLLYEALDRVAEGRGEEALALCEEALEADLRRGAARRSSKRGAKAADASEARLDARIHLLIARLHLDADRLDPAEGAIDDARQTLEVQRLQRWYRGTIAKLVSRLEIRRGQPGKAQRRLSKAQRKGRADDLEGLMLLAVAAHANGDHDLYSETAEAVRERGGDLSALSKR